MKTLHKLLLLIICIIGGQVMVSFCCCMDEGQKPTAAATMTKDEMIVRGRNLVITSGCNDCHSPKIMTQQGPVLDTTRLLSGSPEGMKLPPIDPNQITPGKWYLGSSDLTAWVGPWGVTYAVNLTPDSTTGTGGWTEETFIKILRGGKFMGVDAGRPILPPMTSVMEAAKAFSDNDLKCIFAYLKSLPAIKNHVHDYVPPTEISKL